MEATLIQDKISLLRDQFQREGFIYLPASESFLQPEHFIEIQRLALATLQDPASKRIVDPQHESSAFPIIEDKKEQKPTNVGIFAQDIVTLFNAVQLTEKITNLSLAGSNEALHLRRCQINSLSENDSILAHLDTNANPCYRTGLILGLSSEYTGGDLVINDKQNNSHPLRLGMGDIVILDSKIVHEVEEVESGLRLTLACFWGTNLEENPIKKFASARALYSYFEEEPRK